MIDPLSIAGLTLAVFDQLLKLGDRTVDLVHDVKGFDEESKNMFEGVRHQTWRTKTLKKLLFEDSPVNGYETLFQQFDEDVQDQIRNSLDELVETLSTALRLLERHFEPPRSSHPDNSYSGKSAVPLGQNEAATASTGNNGKKPQVVGRRDKTSPVPFARKLKWSLYNKKRATEIIARFVELNDRLHEKIELWAVASSIGVGIHHLQEFQTNPSAKNLGFEENAKLRLAAANSLKITENFELPQNWESGLGEATLVENRFSTMTWNGRYVLQERCEYKVQSGTDIDNQTRHRVNALAGLLHQPKGQLFRIPSCIGWKYTAESRTIAFNFESPGAADTAPQSLLRLLRSKDVKPSLRDKFMLAYGLARSIAQLQLVQWVHESFRSENILFFIQSTGNVENNVPFDEPWILGFDFSRPESYFSGGHLDICIDRDVYRHPDRQGHFTSVFNKSHDIYALGVVLLEIGLWEPAIIQDPDKFAYTKSPDAIKNRLIKVAQRRLGSRMGPKYTNIVLKCLSDDFGVKDDTKEDIKLQQAFRAQVIDVLHQALDSI